MPQDQSKKSGKKKPNKKKSKKPYKKKMTKSEKKAQKALELQRQLEEERIANLAAAKERRLALNRAEKELAKKDDEQQALRDELLAKVVEKFKISTQNKIELEIAIREEQEWIQYLSVGDRPNPRQAPELSCALHRWKIQRAEGCDFELAQKRDEELYPILNVLDEIIKYPDDLTPKRLQIFKEVREEISEELMASIEAGTRAWVREVCTGLEEVRHAHSTASYRLAIWLLLPLPEAMPRPQDPTPEAIEVDFPELGVNVTLPGGTNWRGSILRGIWLAEDRLSDNCSSYADPNPFPLTYGSDVYEFGRIEYEGVCKLREEQMNLRKEFYADIKTKINVLQIAINEDKFGTLKAERAEIDRLASLAPETMKLPRDIIINKEAEEINEYLKSLIYHVGENEVNLRSHRPCGGILHLELLQQPPRPKTMREQITITLVDADEKLSELKFWEIYNPPPPPAPGAVRTPEEIEADIRRQEAALEKLFLINIQLPDTVLWLEPPVVCCWEVQHNRWTINDIHDLKYNEDKFTVNFRTGQLRPIAFATCKYSNLPYQGWELKPNDDHTGVIITIMGAIIVCEFEVLESGIKMKSLQNGATNALQDMVNGTFTLRELMGRLQKGGVDFFPCEDAPNLIEGSCLKSWIMESHLYHCMAHLCTAYNFTWSRWNVSAGRRAIVQQMREYVTQQSDSFEILHVTPLQAILVTATEVSAEYSTQPLEGLKFYPDLYSLIEGHGNEEAKALMYKVPWQVVENVKDLLCAVKPCSYS